ncbi:calmodulin-binding transcription activator 4 isoform X3 [Typha latifolia]|uniref:calmodulin-binding transcription activator 4 isoform X3 n=1 Tax=Typha latifolia TaxID=4733 RepID=UPI003C2D6F19
MGQGFDIDFLRREAQKRWLKPSEILYILQNHERYPITSQAPDRPPSGSLFLFNRRVLRFFRKDGHAWRKKKDGRNGGEAHEKLKVGNIDALNCYYAHGEQNPYFQRRSYWILDKAYEHIVLVHYREVAEGRFIQGSASNSPTESNSAVHQMSSIVNSQSPGVSPVKSEVYEPYQSSCSSVEEVSLKYVVENFESDNNNTTDRSGKHDHSSQPEVNQALRKLAEQLSLGEDGDYLYFEEIKSDSPVSHEQLQGFGLFDFDTREFRAPHGLEFSRSVQISEAGKQSYVASHSLDVSGDSFEMNESPSWKDMLELCSASTEIDASGRTSELLNLDGSVTDSSGYGTSDLALGLPSKDTKNKVRNAISLERDKIPSIPFGQSDIPLWQKSENRPNGHQLDDSDLRIQLSATRKFLLGSDNSMESPSSTFFLNEVEKPHVFAANTCQVQADDLLLRKYSSTNWMETMSITHPSDFSGLLLDQNHLNTSLEMESSLTLAQKQRFSIREISPEWAFSSESTKVIITGEFLCNPSDCPWAVMFGDVEVPLEIVQQGVLRCQTPQHSVGNVTFCVTSANRESCSEIREFEFRSNLTTTIFGGTSPSENAVKDAEELLLLVKFVRLLICQNDNSSAPKDGVDCQVDCSGILKATDYHWQQLIDALNIGCQNQLGTIDWIMEELLKDKLLHWLSLKYHRNKVTGSFLSKQEQGIIHLISGLGYEWALNSIINAGIGINFRDANGWTALHWAAYFGREKMVAALLAAGASAGAVTDPTPQDFLGKTPGFLASARGHKGLAGYLSEIALTSHLSSLNIGGSEISKGSAAIEAERAAESISERNVHLHGSTEDELSLKYSLAAVRNAAQAAACIQAAFRAHSFRKRQTEASLKQDDYGMTQEDILGLSAASRLHRPSHAHDQKFDKAALSIQKRYRGWKGRKDFLTLRQHVVKIQAHFRGHQVRKKLLWTVSVVEKAILRWRRRGVGLRGFRAEPEMVEEEDDDIAKVFRKQKVDETLDAALSRVLSMVDSPDARQQYRRMLERYRQAKVRVCGRKDKCDSVIVCKLCQFKKKF